MGKMKKRKVVLIVFDALVIALTTLLSNSIIHLFCELFKIDSKNIAISEVRILWIIGLNVLFCFFTFFVFGTYSKIWKKQNITSYFRCVISVVIGLSIAMLFSMLTGHESTWIFYVFNMILTCATVVLFRVLFVKTITELIKVEAGENFERVLIVGAGKAAEMILTDIYNAKDDENNPSRNLLPVCLVDDDLEKQKKKVMGVEVAGTTKDISHLCEEYNIGLILFCIPSCDEDDRKRIMGYCSQANRKIKILPYLGQLLLDGDNPQLLNQVKDIKIEDLLGRDPINFDKTKIKDFIRDKVCMVTGGGGSIGSELVRQVAKYHPKQIIVVDIYENNVYDIQQELLLEYDNKLDFVALIASVRDYDKMEAIFKEYRPQLVFHAAAHKHVPLMETSPAEAVKNNIFGTWNTAQLSDKYDVEKFVMISTDKAVNPTNVMGATKRCCEMIIQYMSQNNQGRTEFVTTRFGNVLGSNGSVIPLFRREIESGKPVTVTHPDIIRYFMTIPEAVSLVLEAGAIASGGEIFVLDMGEPVKITTLAENLIRMYGKVPYKDVPIKFTGLRPGEKLYEELLMDEEGLKSTDNKKIFIGNQIDINEQDLLEKLDVLREYAEQNDDDKTVHQLEQIVDTFHHKTNK